MKKSLCIFLFFISCNFSYGQKSCFNKANEYRAQYLNQTSIPFDSLMFYLKKGQDMLLGCTFPNDTFTTIQNNRLYLESFKGKILIVNFWSVHCPPCLNEIASFHELQKNYKNLVVLAFTLDNKNEVIEFLKKRKFNAEITAEARDFVQKYSLGSGYPFTLVTDGMRKIIYVKNGGKAEPENQMDLFNELKPVIDGALKNK